MKDNVSTIFYMIKHANILTIENTIPPSHKKYTEGVYL